MAIPEQELADLRIMAALMEANHLKWSEMSDEHRQRLGDLLGSLNPGFLQARKLGFTYVGSLKREWDKVTHTVHEQRGGVYIFEHLGRTPYVGETGNLKTRLDGYLYGLGTSERVRGEILELLPPDAPLGRRETHVCLLPEAILPDLPVTVTSGGIAVSITPSRFALESLLIDLIQPKWNVKGRAAK